MTDPVLAAAWMLLLGAGAATVVGARRLGVPATYARDLLHVGAGVWVLGWPWWDGVVAPLAIVATAAVGVTLVPLAAGRIEPAARFHASVAGDDEAFGGIVVYTLSFAVMTALGVTAEPFPAAAFPAAAALWALALGDGLGGLIGRRFGRHFYAAPLGKRKSMEGSAAVAAFATLGAAAAAAWLGVDVAPWKLAALGGVAAVAEGVAPRSTDNATVPAAVWTVALLLG